MKTSIKFIAPALGAAAIGAAMLLAPIASADTDPSTPYGTDPMNPGHLRLPHCEQPAGGRAVLIHTGPVTRDRQKEIPTCSRCRCCTWSG